MWRSNIAGQRAGTIAHLVTNKIGREFRQAKTIGIVKVAAFAASAGGVGAGIELTIGETVLPEHHRDASKLLSPGR